MNSPGVSIAYLILAHQDPTHLRALLRRLDSDAVQFHVHVDRKADLLPFRRALADLDNVYYCEPRVEVCWAAFSVVEATLRLIDSAVSRKNPCTHLVLLSGADYAIATPVEISDLFARNPRRQFIRRFPILESDDTQRWKVFGRHFRELAPRHSWRRPPLFAIERMMRLMPRRLPTDLPLMCGSQWWALTSDCAKFCLDFSRARPDLVRFFRQVFAPDEIFFHTVVHNSPFRPEADPVEAFDREVTRIGALAPFSNLHHLPGWTIASRADAGHALASRPGKLFARKFASGVSADALRDIDQHLDGLVQARQALARPRAIEPAAPAHS